MAVYSGLIKEAFPNIDNELYEYIEGVLDTSSDDFENADDVYGAIGEFLHEVADKSQGEEIIKDLCEQIVRCMRTDGESVQNGERKRLDAPIHLATLAASTEQPEEEYSSIWIAQREDNLRVDARKLEKAEAKLQQKQEKRSLETTVPRLAMVANKTASASQVMSKRDIRLEARGANLCKDIRIENFDVTVGDKCLITGADLFISFGRRYGLVGRNGLGKTTILRMISSKQLLIPGHISILHVEQEVVGDNTLALQSVLECDQQREGLLQEERSITERINQGVADSALSVRLSEIYAELEHMEADKAPARAAVILNGLGFSPEMQSRYTKEFSGGWRMRLALARALFSMPDLLLLDEPTNMLDMKAIIWLEDYLQNWPTTLLVVSHDRQFLEVVPSDMLHLHSQRLDAYKGNYDSFIKTKTERLKNQQREFDAQMQYRAHVQEFIDKFRYNAKRASLVQSKLKLLEKLPELKPVEKEAEVTLKLPEVESLSPPILQLDETSFGYTLDKPIFKGVNLSATMDSRICIVGDNGAGKTTLLKLLMDDLHPTSGTRTAHRNLKFGYFSQHHVDQLDMSQCSVELLQSRFSGRPIEEYRRQLGSFGVSGDLALQQIDSLSGGQKSRVAFAVLCMARPNFFILDEPTNHLDIETIEALGKCINKFKGGVVLVSHDERLIRMVCKELWVCSNSRVSSVEGGFDEYRQIVRRELESAAKR